MHKPLFSHALALSLLLIAAAAAAFTAVFASALAASPSTLPQTPYPAGTVTYTTASGEPATRILTGGTAPEILNVDSANVSADDLLASTFRNALLSSEDHTF